MKKLVLTPKQNGISATTSAIFFLLLIHYKSKDLIDLYFSLHALSQMLVGTLVLVIMGILLGFSKLRDAGYPGSSSRKK